MRSDCINYTDSYLNSFIISKKLVSCSLSWYIFIFDPIKLNFLKFKASYINSLLESKASIYCYIYTKINIFYFNFNYISSIASIILTSTFYEVKLLHRFYFIYFCNLYCFVISSRGSNYKFNSLSNFFNF